MFTQDEVFNMHNQFNWAQLHPQFMHRNDHQHRFAINVSDSNPNPSLTCHYLLPAQHNSDIYLVFLH